MLLETKKGIVLNKCLSKRFPIHSDKPTFSSSQRHPAISCYSLRYIHDNGIQSETSYPYKAHNGGCRADGTSVARLNDWVNIPSGDENAMMDALGSRGPVAVGIDVSKPSFRFYSSGIYNEPTCSTSQLNHAVLAVGYGDGYWLVKNSWGTEWGQDGYVYMTRDGSNQCGIATNAFYLNV